MSLLKIKTYYPETLVKGIHRLGIQFFDKGFEIFHFHSAYAVPTKYFDIREFSGLEIKSLELHTYRGYSYIDISNCNGYLFHHTNTIFNWEKDHIFLEHNHESVDELFKGFCPYVLL